MKEIQISKGYVALVDDADFERVNAVKWYASEKEQTVYARRSARARQKAVLMHRYILNLNDDIHVDHRDGNGLNNQRLNLRTATRAQNMSNRGAQRDNKSGFKGVLKTRSGRWQAAIRCRRAYYYIGLFDDPVQAAKAYDGKALELHGEFAYLNFPEDH